MRNKICNGVYRRRRSKIRLTLDTDQLGEVLGLSSDQVRHNIHTGKLPLTGNAVNDFKVLVEFINAGGSGRWRS